MELIRRLNRAEKERLLFGLEYRFGFDINTWDNYDFLLGSKNRVFITSRNLISGFSGLRAITQGFLFARLENSIKPTTNMIQVFGGLANKNIINLDENQAKKFINGEDLEISHEGLEGYMIVRYKNFFLGCGLLKGSNLKNQVPKGKRMNVEMF